MYVRRSSPQSLNIYLILGLQNDVGGRCRRRFGRIFALAAGKYDIDFGARRHLYWRVMKSWAFSKALLVFVWNQMS